jgi:dephospho-CoA kinase
VVRIGLFGLIASGKSTVAVWFRERGAAVVDGDALGWEIHREAPITAALAEAFGPGIVTADGIVDRAALGRIVFRDAAAMARLNAIVQPRLLERVREALANAASPVVVLDAALLTTWGLEPELDGVVQVVAPESARIERLRQSKGFGAEDAAARIRGQRLPEPKDAKRLWIIQNDGDLAALRRRADAVWRDVTALA